MDRNTFTGLFIIAIILIGFTYFMRPSEAELKREQLLQDSISQAQQSLPTADTAASVAKTAQPTFDSTQLSGPFGNAITGTQSFTTLENDLLKITLSNKGGRIYSVEVKNETSYNGEPIILFTGDENRFGLDLFVGNRNFNTNNLFFEPISVSANQATMRLSYGPDTYIDYIYTLQAGKHLMDFDISMHNMQNVLPGNVNDLKLSWQANLLRQEKDLKWEQRYSTLYYKTTGEEGENVEDLSVSEDESEEVTQPLKWISFKEHFFSSVLIADETFNTANTAVSYDPAKEQVVKNMSVTLAIPFKKVPDQSFGMQYYFGPNHFQTLKKVGYDLEEQIDLGWGPLSWINRWVVIPVFNWLDNFNLSYGIIILVLTLLLKLVLFPLTYSSYISQAKMRVLKPEMDEIKAKYEKEPQKVQQEYLKLYKSAGVNPIGGCIPMLMQMPILLAFFYFFPASFELRQESFLWVNDLSTYDAFFKFGFTIPFVGDHLSLMCILMTLSTILYTYMNNQVSGVTGQMKYIGYIMPIMFLGFLNSYPAGLNYYYLCANLITFSQQFFIRKFIDEDAIHQKIQENKKRPSANKKSKFQARLEQMMKEQQTKSAGSKKK